jgi:hypothetical protein
MIESNREPAQESSCVGSLTILGFAAVVHHHAIDNRHQDLGREQIGILGEE